MGTGIRLKFFVNNKSKISYFATTSLLNYQLSSGISVVELFYSLTHPYILHTIYLMNRSVMYERDRFAFWDYGVSGLERI